MGKKKLSDQVAGWDSHASKTINNDISGLDHSPHKSDLSGDEENDQTNDDNDHRDVNEDAAESNSRVERARNPGDAKRLVEHVLDLSTAEGGEQDDATKYDLDAELGHLEEKDIKVRCVTGCQEVMMDRAGKPISAAGSSYQPVYLYLYAPC